LKKIPPILVTFLVDGCSMFFVVIVLNANPRKKVAVHARVITSLFFIAVVLIRMFKCKENVH